MPEVRFPGFSDAWEQREVGEVVQRVCVGFVGTLEKYYTDSTGIPLYRTGNLAGLKLNTKDLKYVTKQFHLNNAKSQLKYGDILIARHGESGKAVIYESNKEANCLNIVIIRPNLDTSNSFFLVNCINSPVPNQQIKNLSAGSTQVVINTKEIEKLKLCFPRKKEEQEKIGSFFKRLDETIDLHQRELNTLKQTKQGFLQKMFPKEGESVPEVRFPGFSGEWEQFMFSDIANVRRGLTYKPADVSTEGVRVLRSSNINGDTFEIRTDDIFVKKSAVKIATVKDNDILITSANGSSRLVGKHALIQGIKGDMVHGGFMLLATSSQPHFVNALMSSSWYDKFINLYVSGGNGAIGNISKSDLESQIVYIPIVEEQVQIGNFFKQLDQTIALQEKELEALQQTKKAFLQKMFV